MDITRVITLRQEEEIFLVVRSYWLTQVGKLLFAFLLTAMPFFFMIPLFRLGWYGLAIFGVSALVGVFVALRTFYLWYWNSFLVTSERVIDIDQRGFFDRVVSEAAFDKIQDVSYRIKGIVGTLLHYGTVVIQTAGTNTNLELMAVRDPQDIQHEIAAHMAAYFGQAGRGSAKADRAADLIEAAAEMSDAEARAFVVELQAAMVQERAEAARRRPADEKTAIQLPDDWRDEKDKDEDRPIHWKRRRM